MAWHVIRMTWLRKCGADIIVSICLYHQGFDKAKHLLHLVDVCLLAPINFKRRSSQQFALKLFINLLACFFSFTMPLSSAQRLVFEMLRDEALAQVREARRNWVYYNVLSERLTMQSDVAHSIIYLYEHENQEADLDFFLPSIANGLRGFAVDSPVRLTLEQVLRRDEEIQDHIGAAYAMLMANADDHNAQFYQLEQRMANITATDVHEDMRALRNMNILLHRPSLWTASREYLTPNRIRFILETFVATDVGDPGDQGSDIIMQQRTESDEEYDRIAEAIDIAELRHPSSPP